MNTKMRFVTTTALLLALAGAPAAEKKIEAGPKGGRVLPTRPHKTEFFVEKDRSVTFTFYDAALKPIAAAEQSVIVIADAGDAKARIEFEKEGGVLVSKTKLPEGDRFPLVVQYREKPDSKPQNFRFNYDSHTCTTCKRVEYACICDH